MTLGHANADASGVQETTGGDDWTTSAGRTSVTLAGNLEREVKLEVGLRFALPDLDGVAPGVTATQLPDAKLQAVYVDTPDLRLMRWGITLRHRHDAVVGGTGESGWTVKLPGEADGVALVRQEVSVPGKLGPVPAEISRLVKAPARSSPLGPVAKLTTQRRRVELRDADGTRLAEIADDLVSVHDGRRLAARFREVEVEIFSAAPADLLDAVLERMTAVGALRGDDRPKVVRALGPRAASPPDVVVPDLDKDATVADVIRASIASAMTRMVRHDPGIRLGDDPEHVHQARVGTRRLRSDLRTFRSLLDQEWSSRVRTELGWVADALGEVRDADVLTERLRAQIATLPDGDARPAAALLRRLAVQRDEARTRMLDALDSDRYVALLDELARASTDPPLVGPQSGRTQASVNDGLAAAALAPELMAAAEVAGWPGAVSGLVVPVAGGTRRGAPHGGPTSNGPAGGPATGGAATGGPAMGGPATGGPATAGPATTGTPTNDAAADGSGSNGAVKADSPQSAGRDQEPPIGERPAREVLPSIVRTPWRHLRRAVSGLGEDPPDEALHQVRIRAKRLRYAAEAATPVMGKPAKKLAVAVTKVQSVLGDMQDAVVAEAWLRKVGTSGSAAQALVAGELVARQRDQQAACRNSWTKPWKGASATNLRTWLKD